ncbi:MAG: helicase [Candidatus Anammoxibacter sp.]
MKYDDFIKIKSHEGSEHGFEPIFMPDFLFDFQEDMVDWAIRKGRTALLEDCGLGKTPQSLVWAHNVVLKTNKPVLYLTPIAVSAQTVREGDKFGIPVTRSYDGSVKGEITVTNYEKLHMFDSSDYSGIVCDESSILKSFNGQRRSEITYFMRKIPYRLLCTATAAPNDYHEFGTSSEALGHLGYMDMLHRFFKNDSNNSAIGRKYGEVVKWRFKGHADLQFWRWITSWARAIRKPSDIGYSDDMFTLPPLVENIHKIKANKIADGSLFNLPAVTLPEQREERKRTIKERCLKVADLVDHDSASLIWCHLNDEGKELRKIIPDSVEVSGSDSDEAKEEKFLAFIDGDIKKLITKPKIGAWGLNFQHCSHITSFPSHSYEQYYQGVRRCYRFGQKNTVTVDTVLTEGDMRVMDNQQRKSKASDEMFVNLIKEMNNAVSVVGINHEIEYIEVPSWIK